MSHPSNDLKSVMSSGKNLVGVQTDSFPEIQVALTEADPSGNNRALISWDGDDGFQPLRDVMEELPECTDLIEALEFVEQFRGEAVFLFDGTGGAFHAEANSVRPRLKKLLSKTAVGEDLAVVIAVKEPLPQSLTTRMHWIGEQPTADEGEENAESSTKGARSSGEWNDLRNLEAFDSEKWQTKLESLTIEQAEEIVRGGHHRDPLERLGELQSQLKERFVQKDEIIDAISASAIAQVPCVLMGPPGTAKGHLIRTFCEGLGLTQYEHRSNGDGKVPTRKYFEYQLTRFTTPEELFGPVHVQDLIDRQMYRRVTAGYLPAAHVAFLDELFKASSAILNTLLSILNERVFYNEGKPEQVPLTTIFAASNEPPQEESLAALFDRFPIRVNCPSVEDDQLPDLLNRSWGDSFDRKFSVRRQAQEQVSCANDLRLLNKVSLVMFSHRNPDVSWEARKDHIEAEFLRRFRMMRREAGISDRSLAMLYAYARANALLRGRNELSKDDLRVYSHVVWGQAENWGDFFDRRGGFGV